MCAITAKQHNSKIKVAIIEKNDRVGKKLLATGNGRCNITNSDICARHYCGSFAEKGKKLFQKYSADYILDFFSELGLLTVADSDGRYYPACKQASAVLDVLRFACERLKVDIFCKENIKSIKKLGDSFFINTETNSYKAKKLVIACGSKSAPQLGGNASAIDYLRNFGHRTIPYSPALCPIKTDSTVLKSLKGLRCSCKAALEDENGNLIKTEFGEVQFTDTALSGICIFNLSLFSRKNYNIVLDLLPDISLTEIYALLNKQIKLFGSLPLENLFTGIFHKRLGQAVIKCSGINNISRSCKALTQNEIKAICKTIKYFRFKVIENCGFNQSQASLGGVIANEIDENTMQSKIKKNLYIIGEAVDICGECGGFNLHFAFASGHLAGENL